MRKKAAFIGLTNVDYIYYIDSFPKEDSKCKTSEYTRNIGGPAANAAITYAHLGGDATLITALGSSDEAGHIVEELATMGVRVINVAKDAAIPSTSSILVSKKGYRTIISGQNEFKEINLEGIDLSEYDFAMFDCNQENIALPLLKRLNCDIVLDAGSFKEYTDEFLKKARIVISSEHFKDRVGRDIFELPYSNIELKAMTRGEKSILTNEGEIAVEQVECVDSLAAGDIFHGAFCFAFYENNMSFDDALRFAASKATESVKHRGPR